MADQNNTVSYNFVANNQLGPVLQQLAQQQAQLNSQAQQTVLLMSNIASGMQAVQQSATGQTQATNQLASSYIAMAQAIQQQTQAYAQAQAAQLQFQQQQAAARQTAQQAAQQQAAAAQAAQQAAQATQQFWQQAFSVAAGLGIATSIQAVVAQLKQVTVSMIDTGAQLQTLRLSLNATSGGVQEGQRVFASLTETSNRLGVNTIELATNFRNMQAAVKGTTLEGGPLNSIFLAVTEAGKTLGLSGQQVSQALLAVDRMMQTNVINARELRLQLGIHLPGAIEVMARALGVSVQRLFEMTKSGELLADEVLPKFARQLRQELGSGAEAASQTALSAFARLENEWTALKDRIARSGPLEFVTKVAGAVADVLHPSTVADQERQQREADRAAGLARGTGGTAAQLSGQRKTEYETFERQLAAAEERLIRLQEFQAESEAKIRAGGPMGTLERAGAAASAAMGGGYAKQIADAQAEYARLSNALEPKMRALLEQESRTRTSAPQEGVDTEAVTAFAQQADKVRQILTDLPAKLREVNREADLAPTAFDRSAKQIEVINKALTEAVTILQKIPPGLIGTSDIQAKLQAYTQQVQALKGEDARLNLLRQEAAQLDTQIVQRRAQALAQTPGQGPVAAEQFTRRETEALQLRHITEQTQQSLLPVAQQIATLEQRIATLKTQALSLTGEQATREAQQHLPQLLATLERARAFTGRPEQSVMAEARQAAEAQGAALQATLEQALKQINLNPAIEAQRPGITAAYTAMLAAIPEAISANAQEAVTTIQTKLNDQLDQIGLKIGEAGLAPIDQHIQKILERFTKTRAELLRIQQQATDLTTLPPGVEGPPAPPVAQAVRATRLLAELDVDRDKAIQEAIRKNAAETARYVMDLDVQVTASGESKYAASLAQVDKWAIDLKAKLDELRRNLPEGDVNTEATRGRIDAMISRIPQAVEQKKFEQSATYREIVQGVHAVQNLWSDMWSTVFDIGANKGQDFGVRLLQSLQRFFSSIATQFMNSILNAIAGTSNTQGGWQSALVAVIGNVVKGVLSSGGSSGDIDVTGGNPSGPATDDYGTVISRARGGYIHEVMGFINQVPRAAKGMVVHGPQLAWLGDNASRWEAAIPLDGNRSVPVTMRYQGGGQQQAQEQAPIIIYLSQDFSGALDPRTMFPTRQEIIPMTVRSVQEDGPLRRVIIRHAR